LSSRTEDQSPRTKDFSRQTQTTPFALSLSKGLSPA
jgi:hypothetical protein